MEGAPDDAPTGYVPVRQVDGSWKTSGGEAVAWYEVRTDLLAASDIEAAIERVLTVYGVSDVVVDAFDQLRKELPGPSAAAAPSE